MELFHLMIQRKLNMHNDRLLPNDLHLGMLFDFLQPWHSKKSNLRVDCLYTTYSSDQLALVQSYIQNRMFYSRQNRQVDQYIALS